MKERTKRVWVALGLVLVAVAALAAWWVARGLSSGKTIGQVSIYGITMNEKLNLPQCEDNPNPMALDRWGNPDLTYVKTRCLLGGAFGDSSLKVVYPTGEWPAYAYNNVVYAFVDSTDGTVHELNIQMQGVGVQDDVVRDLTAKLGEPHAVDEWLPEGSIRAYWCFSDKYVVDYYSVNGFFSRDTGSLKVLSGSSFDSLMLNGCP